MSIAIGSAIIASLLSNIVAIILQQILSIYFYLAYKDLSGIKGASSLARGRTNKVWAIVLVVLALLIYLASLIFSSANTPTVDDSYQYSPTATTDNSDNAAANIDANSLNDLINNAINTSTKAATQN